MKFTLNLKSAIYKLELRRAETHNKQDKQATEHKNTSHVDNRIRQAVSRQSVLIIVNHLVISFR